MKRIACLLLAVLLCSASASPALAQKGDVRDFLSISRRNPVLVGEIASFSYKSNDMGVTLCVTDVIRGQAALDIVLAANSYNDKPGPGQEIYLATVHVTMQCATDERLELDWLDFEYVTSDGVADYTKHFSGIKGDINLYPDGSGDMQIALITDTDDIPMLLFQEVIWFALQ